jgi:hypothetical protein
MTIKRESPLRLTFNKPAVVQYIRDDEQTKGLKIRVEDGMVHFLPVDEITDGDVVPLIGDKPGIYVRKRGGAEVIIEGSMADDVADAFQNESGPFFVLSRQKNTGWLVAKPHLSAEAPSKFTAHLRVWNDEYGRMSQPDVKAKKTTRKISDKTATKTSSIFDISDPMERINKAREIVNAVRGPGRPSRAYVEARDAVAAFDQSTDMGIGDIELQTKLTKIRSEIEVARTSLVNAEDFLSKFFKGSNSTPKSSPTKITKVTKTYKPRKIKVAAQPTPEIVSETVTSEPRRERRKVEGHRSATRQAERAARRHRA